MDGIPPPLQEHGKRAAHRRMDEHRSRILDRTKMKATQGIPSSSPHRRRKRSTSLSSNLQKLSLLNTNPTFEYPTPAHPRSAQEETLSQELALCDFRSYLLAMEAQNRERLRVARGNEWIASDGHDSESPVDDHDEQYVRNQQQLIVQAEELAKKRLELQEQLEGLTGRQYPLPQTYWEAEGLSAGSTDISNATRRELPLRRNGY